MPSRRPIVALALLLLLVIGGAVWMVASDAPTSTDQPQRDPVDTQADAPSQQAGSNARTSGAREERTGTVTGRLRDERTGSPVPGAAVLITPRAPGTQDSSTDTTGAFSVQDLPASAALQLRVSAPGVGARDVAIEALQPGEVRDLGTLWLSRRARLTVLVLAPDGQPLPAAPVRIRAAVWSNAPGPVERAAVTDADGRAVFDDLPAASWYVRAEPEGVAPAEERGRPLRPGQDLTLTLRTRLGHTLRGRVTDPSGRPLAGVRIAPIQAGRAWAQSQQPGDEVLTAEDGTYAFHDLAAGKTTLRAGFGDTDLATVGAVWVPAEHAFDFTLRPGGTIVGRVTDEAGTPVRGARVTAGGRSAGMRSGATVETDAQGRYRIEGLLEVVGVYLRAQATGHLQSTWSGESFDLGPGETVTRNLTLRGGARIHGVVTDGVGPVPDAIVVVRADDRRLSQSAARTDSTGRYELVVPVPLRAKLTATRAGYHLPESPDRVLTLTQSDEQEIDLELIRNVVLRGRCEFADGTRAVGVAVRWQPKWPYLQRGPVVAFSGASGEFELAGAMAGETGQLVTEGREFAPVQPLPWVNVESDADVGGLRLLVERFASHAVRGTVRYDDGSPATDAVLTADGAAPVRPAADGSFHIQFARPVQRVRVDANARALSAHATAEFEPGETECRVELVLGGGLSITGTVIGDGRPLEGAQVLLGDDLVVGLTDDRGAFRIDGLSAGRSAVGISAEGFGRRITLVQLPLREPLRLEFRRLQDLRGRVVDQDGRGVARADVMVAPSDSRARAELWDRRAVTDEQGRFVLRGMQPDPCRLTVYPTAWSPSFVQASAQVAEGPWEEDVRIEVELGGVIEGSVLDADGLPAQAAEVRAYGAAGQPGAVTRLDEFGRFRLVGLRTGTYVVAALKGDRTIASRGQVETGTRDVRLVAVDAGTISGVLRAADGEPAPSRVLLAIPHGAAAAGLQALVPAAKAVTGPDGRFTLGPVPDGRYRVCATDPGEADFRIALGSDAGVEDGAIGVGLRLPRRHTLVLVVLNDVGEAVGHRGLRLRHLPTGRRLSIEPSKDAETRIPGLLAGSYEVEGWVPDADGRPWHRKFGTVLGEAGRAELRPE